MDGRRESKTFAGPSRLAPPALKIPIKTRDKNHPPPRQAECGELRDQLSSVSGQLAATPERCRAAQHSLEGDAAAARRAVQLLEARVAKLRGALLREVRV
jgi:hypothetical protein